MHEAARDVLSSLFQVDAWLMCYLRSMKKKKYSITESRICETTSHMVDEMML
jgi:hypothetical protein